MDEALWDQTVAVSLEAGIIPEAPGEGAWRSDLAQAALDALAAEMPDLDLTGENFEPVVVELREGGE
jgi:hypothetical protein